MTTPLRILLLFVILLAPACSRHKVTSTAVRRYPIEGEVLRLNQADQTATIKHQEIKGWMGAMTMDYQVPSKTDYARLHPGEHFKATVFVQDEEFWVGDVQDAPVKP
jgi:protein SCO1/2